MTGSLVSAETEYRSQPKIWGLSFDSPLSRDDMGLSTEPLILSAFLLCVPPSRESGHRHSAFAGPSDSV